MEQKISIIVPIYNNEKYLQKCLQSISIQTYSNIEVLMINDGSIDSSETICLEFAKNDNRFIYIGKQNEGVSVARNVGLNNMTGDYFAFIDSDDWIESTFCEKMIASAITENADMVFCGINNWNCGKKYQQDESAGMSEVVQNKRVEHFLIGHKQYVSGPVWRVLYKTNKLGNIRFDARLHACEDTPFLLECIYKADKLTALDECLYNYNVPQVDYFKKYYRDDIIEEGFYLGCKVNEILLRFGITEWAKAELFKRYCVIVDWICSSVNSKKLFRELKIHEGLKKFNTKENYHLYKKNYKRNKIKIGLIRRKWFAIYKLLFALNKKIKHKKVVQNNNDKQKSE